MAVWTWAGASRRGTSHALANTRRQDAYAAFASPDGRAIAIVVSDGAGSASMGGEGASLVCRTFATGLRASLAATDALPSDEDLWRWIDETRDRIGHAAASRGLTPRDFAATLVLAVCDGARTLVAHVGDGACVARTTDGGEWAALSWPAHGEYVSTTRFVTDDPAPELRIVRPDATVDALAAFSDGIERLALDYANERAHAPFFRGIVAPVIGSPATGRDAALSRMLGDYLDGPAINDRTDDDKTLVVAALR